MSIHFVIGDGTTVWNPASSPGRLFLGAVCSLARELDVDSGLGAVVADEVAIEPTVLADFCDRLLDEVETGHAATAATAAGPAAICIVLASRSGVPVEVRSGLSDVFATADDLAATMHRG